MRFPTPWNALSPMVFVEELEPLAIWGCVLLICGVFLVECWRICECIYRIFLVSLRVRFDGLSGIALLLLFAYTHILYHPFFLSFWTVSLFLDFQPKISNKAILQLLMEVES